MGGGSSRPPAWEAPGPSSGDPDLRRKLVWVALLYFAEGFPFGLVYEMFPVYFRTAGVSLREIGLLSLLGLPWTLKVLWSPLVDRFGRRQTWIVSALVVMAAILLLMPLFPLRTVPQESTSPAASALPVPSTAPGTPATSAAAAASAGLPLALTLLLIAFTASSATQDIAVDAYTIGLMKPGQEGPANSVRVSAYRAALIVGGGGLVMLSGVLTWPLVFVGAAAILLLLAVAAWRSPQVQAPGPARRATWRPLLQWARRPGWWAVFPFILLFKLGDSSMGPMVKPFWVDRGLSAAEIGLISTSFGVVATVAGAMVGGAWVARLGIFRGLWLLGLFQAVSNLGYATVAALDLSRGYVYGASIIESFTGGMGTAAFLSFLMRICQKEHAAVQYALLSALFGFTRSVAGGVSGYATERLGYASYFAWTFVLSFPAYALLPWVRSWVRPGGLEEVGEPDPAR